MGYALLLIKNILFGGINLFAGKYVLQTILNVLAIDICDSAKNLHVGSYQHLLDSVVTLFHKTLVTTNKLLEFLPVFIGNVARLVQPLLKNYNPFILFGIGLTPSDHFYITDVDYHLLQAK